MDLSTKELADEEHSQNSNITEEEVAREIPNGAPIRSSDTSGASNATQASAMQNKDQSSKTAKQGEGNAQYTSNDRTDLYPDTMQVDAEESDAEMSNADPDDVAGAFLGDFEEIEEDEDVERLISQNHTPTASAHQSPQPLRPRIVGKDVAGSLDAAMSSNNESSDDSDDNFESIPELSGSLSTQDLPPDSDAASKSTDASVHSAELDQTASTKSAADTNHVHCAAQLSEAQTTALEARSKGLDALQRQFREKYIPKLEQGLFFNMDVYKKYTIVTTTDKPALSTSSAPKAPAPVANASAPAAAQQKPSSLRGSGSSSAEAKTQATAIPAPKVPVKAALLSLPPPAKQVQAETGIASSIISTPPKPSDLAVSGPSADAPTSKATEAPAATRQEEARSGPNSPASNRTQEPPSAQQSPRSSNRAKSALSERDDVVGALLGAMKSPTMPQTHHKQHQPQTQPQFQPQPQLQQLRKPENDEASSQSIPPGASNTISHSIPDDMLAAMQAIEGTGGPQTTAAVHASGSAPTDLASRLPKGYSGPFSQLSLAEHSFYVAQTQRMKAGELSAKENAEYQRLKAKVESEQQKFRTQARENVLPLLAFINKSVSTTVRDELAKSMDEDASRYPRLYSATKITTIRPVASGYTPLVYKDTLLQRGVCYRANVPALESGPFEIPPTLDPWSTAPRSSHNTRRGSHRTKYTPMSQDPFTSELVGMAGADVALSASALSALLTLPRTYNRDVIIPFKVIEITGASGQGSASEDKVPTSATRRVVVVDKPLPSVQGTTPRRLNSMFYSSAVETHLVDGADALELAGGSAAGSIKSQPQSEEQKNDDTSDNKNYTLWEFGGMRVLIRYKVHAFSPVDAGAGNKQAQSTTVTFKTKLEYQLGQKSLGTAGSSRAGGVFEEMSESERLSWWMSCYLRGNPSEVWVSHIDVHKSAIVRVSKLSCGDLYSGVSASESGARALPSTRGVLSILQDLLALQPGQYMLVHKRRTWDATIYRAVSDDKPGSSEEHPAQRGGDAQLNLASELNSISTADPIQLDIEGDFVPGAWQGLPGQIPFTYPPSDLADLCSGASAWPSRKRQWGAGKRKKKAKKA
ncbi:hypothetical protein GGI12_004011 [Dipsacomyces acuminosporus]|nr:hypothetical protein GGI12_004011 [Dipsacomyces acuminosporus]